MTWFRRAADTGFPSAMSRLAEIHERGLVGEKPDTALARQWYTRAAERNDPFAHVGLGRMYARGSGTAADGRQAATHFERAAELGSAAGMFELATLYAEGAPGIERDQAKAVQLFRTAADAGDASAMLRLAGIYAQGQSGLPRDVEASRMWLRRAAEAGHPQARELLGLPPQDPTLDPKR